MIRGFLIAAASALAIGPAMAGPPATPPAAQAYVDVYFGSGGQSPDTSVTRSHPAGLITRLNVPFAADWNLQFDGQGESRAFEFGQQSDLAGYLHVYRRTYDSALGVFAGLDRRDPLSQTTTYAAGVEGQLYWSHLTLYGQGAVATDNSPLATTSYWLRGEAQFFATDNTMLAGDVMWTHSSNEFGSDDLTLSEFGIHRLAGSPFGLWKQVRYDHFDSSFSTDSWTALVGLRLFFDPPGSTLRSNSITGPAMTVPLMPLRASIT